MKIAQGYARHPFGMTKRDCPACGKPQVWCGSLECHGANNGSGHWSHATAEDAAACSNLCEKPS